MASLVPEDPVPEGEAGPSGSQEVEPAAGASSAEQRCPICLEDFQDKSFIDACFHAFCFACIVQWAEVTNSCPMCKNTFSIVIHNIRAIDDYEQFDVNPKPTPSNQEVSIHEARRFRYHTTRIPGEPRPLARGLQRRSHVRQSRKPAAEERRRAVYSARLWAQPLETGGRHLRIRNISAAFFRENPACSHRLSSWLAREFKVLLGQEHVEFMIQLVMSLIDKVDMENEEFARHLDPFLHEKTSHFVHEFVSFAKSPFDMIAYDAKVRYDWPENRAPRDNWDPEATLVAPASASLGLTPAAMQQRIFEELTTTGWDDSPPILPSSSPIVVHDSDSEPDLQSPFHTAQSVVHTATTSGIEPGPSSNGSVVTTSEPRSQPVYIIATGRFVPASSSAAVGGIQPQCDGESVSNEITTTTEGAQSTTVNAVKPSSCSVTEQRVEDTSYAISVHVENAGELDLSASSSLSNPRDSSTEELRARKVEDRVNEKERGRERSRRETRKDHSESSVRAHPDSVSEHEDSRRRRHHGRSKQHGHGHSSYRRRRLESFSSDDSYDHLRRERRRREGERERRYDDAGSSRARGDYRSSHRETYYGDHDYDRFTDTFSMSNSYYQRDEHHHRSRMYSDDYPTDATSHQEHVHRERHHSSSDHSDGEHGSRRRRKHHQHRRSSSSSWEKERKRRKTRRHSRERKHRHHSKHEVTQDAVVVQLSDELSQLDEQIRNNKKQLLKSLLCRERLELLHKALHSETVSGDAPESETSEAAPRCIVEPVRIATNTPTNEMLKELTFLDQAIKDGKRQILRVMKRMEEQEAEEHGMDSS